MKINAVQYAKTLYELTRDKERGEIDSIVFNFAKILQKNSQAKIVESVIKKFKEIHDKENKIVEAEVVSREELNGVLVDKLNNFIKKKYEAKDVVINNKIDENIKGGIIIRVGDEIFDASINKQLINLKKQLSH